MGTNRVRLVFETSSERGEEFNSIQEVHRDVGAAGSLAQISSCWNRAEQGGDLPDFFADEFAIRCVRNVGTLSLL